MSTPFRIDAETPQSAPSPAGVRSVYQPIVNLLTRDVVGYEALARTADDHSRWPAGLFSDARERGRLGELDWACRAAAVQGALRGGLAEPLTLFVNVEPEAIDVACPAELRETIARGRQGLRSIVEVTERALTEKPAELLRVVEEVRQQGAGVALDDVGADWRSLALMPFIRPDVVKLDMHLVQEPLTSAGAAVTEAVRAYTERSGAQIIAEGIETEAHRERALSLGASFGQGWMFGRPGPLPTPPPDRVSSGPQLVVAEQPLDNGSPMSTIAQLEETAVATKAELLAVSRAIEQRALRTTEPAVVLTVFQDAQWFTPATARMYSRLAARSAFVGAFGRGMPATPAPGVRGASLPINEHLLGEWAVILVTPHDAVALVARDLGDTGPETEQRLRYTVLTHRDLVLRAARSLMLKMSAARAGGRTIPIPPPARTEPSGPDGAGARI